LKGKYTLVREIARGGLGQIYFGEDPQLDRQVAVKVSRVAYGGEDPRFSKEAKVLAHLAHPNIVPIYNIGVDAQGRPFYAMKLVKGRTLQAVLDALRGGDAVVSKEYPRGALLTVFQKVCDAMAFAHSKGILHRDLKPENIMVGEYGEVLVMDWGLAKVLGDGSKDDGAAPSATEAADGGDYGVTLEGEVMGTPQYMSPEQAEGMVAELDARSDIYALGGILYAILTLRPPIDGKTLDEVLTKVKRGEISAMVTKRGMKAAAGVSAPAAMGEEVPEALQLVTLKAMATNRVERYASVEALAADIDAYQHGFATSAEHAGFLRQIFLLIKRNRAVSALCALFLISALVFSLRLVASERTARANEQKAIRERTAAQASKAKAQIALAQSEEQAKSPEVMRRILDEVPREFRDQYWSYLDAKLAPPASFDLPNAPVELAFSSNRAPGCFLVIQRNGDVCYLDPVSGFGSPLFRLPVPLKDLSVAFFEEGERALLGVTTNRPFFADGKNYPASLELLELPGGGAVYKAGVDLPCATLDFSPKGNLLCIGRRPPSPSTLEMRNAHSGEVVWAGGPKESVSAKFSPDEKRLVCVVDGKGFQDLDPWTGALLGALKKGPGRSGVWSPQADRLYAIWNYADRAWLRAYGTDDGAGAFERTIQSATNFRVASAGSGKRLVLSTSRSASSRVVELLDSSIGTERHTQYLLGNFDKLFLHGDENHLLCLGEKKGAFLRWDLATSLVPWLPRLDGPFWLLDGGAKVLGVTSIGVNTLRILDLTKSQIEDKPAFSAKARNRSLSFNRERNLFSYQDEARSGECVIARVEATKVAEVARWKCASPPLLSPSGTRVWTRDGLFEAATGKMLQKYTRKNLGGTVWVQWLDEERVLELLWVKKDDEIGELYETAYELWEAATGEILLQLPEPRARTFGVSPDGLWIAEGGSDGLLRIRSAQTLETRKEYKVHDSSVLRAVWHPTKPVVLTCSRDFWVKAWDARDGSLVRGYRCLDYPTNIDVSMKGDRLGVGSYNKSLILTLELSHLRD
jgi:serine/threonine protein kinase/WD40 repeat protein